MVAVGATGNGGRGTNVRNDRLLKVSDFLNQFQAHFLPPLAKKRVSSDSNGHPVSQTSVGEITVQDVEDAFEFRSLLEQLEILEEEQFVLGRREAISEPIARQVANFRNKDIESIRIQIQAIPDRTKLIVSMLRRFEVWISKLVAQDQLLTPTRFLPETTKQKNKTDLVYFSPFMNIPPSSHFAQILPSKKAHSVTATAEEAINSSPSISAFHRKNMCTKGCTLALPPNKHTWEAYARFAVMVSLVGDDELSGCDSESRSIVGSKKRSETPFVECIKSPLCVHHLNKHKKGKNPSFNHKYSYSLKSDLLPLWMRSRRNTQALRQLIQLFEVRREGEHEKKVSKPSATRENSTVANAENTSQSTSGENQATGGSGGTNPERGERADKESIGQFKATFRGNSEHVQHREEVDEKVDRLIEWAVVNQSIFTYSHIRKEILTSPLYRQQKAGRKRQRDGSHHRISSKKAFRDTDSDQNLFELHQACQSYLLRWFARRNRNALTMLFSKRIENLASDIGCLVNNRVLSQAKALKQANVPSRVQEDLNNAQNGKFHPEDRTLSRIDRRLFINDRYNGTGNITCRSQLSKLLKTFSDACPENQRSHKKLIQGAIEDLENLFETFYPNTTDDKNLDDVYRVASQLVDPPHGCSESSLIVLMKNSPAPWSEKCYKCNETGSRNLRACFNCEKVFHEKCSGSGCNTGTLKDFVSSFPPLHDIFKLKHPKNLKCPDFSKSEEQWVEKTIHIERKVTGDGKVKKLGISFSDTEDCSSAFEMIESDAFSLLKLMKSEEKDAAGKNVLTARIGRRGCLVKEVHEGLSGGKAGLRVGDIIIGIEILKYVRVQDEKKYGAARKIDFSDLSSDERSALLKAQSLQLNLIVLRPPINIIKIASDWYATTKRINKCALDVLRGIRKVRPWYCGSCIRSGTEEQSKSVFVEASYCRAVIRRVGMESYSRPFTEGMETSQSGYFCLRRLDAIMTHIMGMESKDEFYGLAPGSFFAPSPVSSKLQRLPWATEALESRPMELLCKAMKTLVRSEFPGKGHMNTQRSALLRHFLLAFSSYCVGSTIKSDHFKQLIGPPKTIQYSKAPFSRCFSLSATSDIPCVGDEFLGLQRIDTIDRVQVEKARNSMIEYLRNASLVGKTFLVHPSDPLVQHVSKIVPILHENRPVEFVVASYLPSSCCNEVMKDRQKEEYDQFDGKDGVYHLLPVISSHQQNFLLERCRMRDQKLGKNSDSSWMSLDVLDLQGVARYSPVALRCKMNHSTEMRLAIDHATVLEVCASTSESLRLAEQVSSPFTMTESSSSPTNFALEIQERLLDTLLKGETTREALRELSDIDESCDQIDRVTHNRDNSNREIVQCEEKSESVEVGLSPFKKGFLPINPVEAPWNILKLHNVEEVTYSLFYSDHFFSDEASKQCLLKKLHPPFLLPSRSSKKSSLMTFKLSNGESNVGATNMFGWGFEILRWTKESQLRVGRVLRGSPAFKAGLRPHDIIESINGVKFSWFPDISSMVCSILGVSNVRVRLPRNLHRIDEISTLLWTIKNAKTMRSSITLIVFRPSSDDNQSDPSETSNPGSEFPVQHSHHGRKNVESKGAYGQNIPLSSHHERNIRSQSIDQSAASEMSNSGSELLVQHSCQSRTASQRNVDSNGRSQNIPLPPHHERTSSFDVISSLLQNIRRTYNNRSPARQSDLYRPAKHGTILTALEAAVFLECLVNRTWKLGLRLLMPRYELSTINEQVRILFSWKAAAIESIPIVKGKCHRMILELDYKRMTCKKYPETGPIILTEKKDGVRYEYRRPVRSLPIDRIVERVFGDAQLQFRQQLQESPQQEHPQPQHQHHQYQDPRAQYRLPRPPNHHLQYLNQNRGHGYNINHQNQRANPEINCFDQANTQVSCQPGANPRIQGQVPHPPTTHLHVQQVPSVTQRNNEEVQTHANFVNLLEDEIDPELRIEEPSLLMTLTRNQQREVSTQQEYVGADQYCERIRGGGNTDTDEPNNSTNDNQINYLYLCDVPQNRWKGTAVYTFVQISSKGSICEDALLVGFVRKYTEVDSHDKNVPHKVELETYYLSGAGYFERTKMHQVDSDDVWVVNIEGDCEEARVIAKLHSQNKVPSDYKEGHQKAILRNTASCNDQEENESCEEMNLSDGRQEEHDADCSPAAVTFGGEDVRRIDCGDALRLEPGQEKYNYTCEGKPLDVKSLVENDSSWKECSLCSLPFERYLPGDKQDAPKSLGCSLMSDLALTEDPCRSSIPGRLGEGKTLLLKIASLIPSSFHAESKSVPDPLSSFRIFDNTANYALWKDFVAECSCTEMLAQALVGLLASIDRSKLPDWWSRKDSGWSTPYPIMAESSLSMLYLHIYVLDAALSDVISRSLNTKPNRKASNQSMEKQRTNKYWERSLALGYKAFKGDHSDRCYHCNDVGDMLKCDLCPNVQHHECCDPVLSKDTKFDYWVCDSCVNDIDNFNEDAEFEDEDEEDFA